MLIVLMGVTGSGKTTVGELLAQRLRCSFFDADAYHPPQNVEKMRNGIPLSDEDRRPWLNFLASLLADEGKEGKDAVLACSALKQEYRMILSQEGKTPILFVFLDAGKSLIAARLDGRTGHYMNPSLVDSQFAALEAPAKDEALHVDATATPEHIVSFILSRLPEQHI